MAGRDQLIIPRRLVSEVRRRGLSLEDIVLEALVERLGLDPREFAEIRLELAQRYLVEGKRLADKDPVQASEKLYKAAEESIKALVEHLGLEEIIVRVRERGRRTMSDLEKAARVIARTIGEDFYVAWDRACYLHVWGFHESKLDTDAVKARIPYIEKLVEKTAEVLQKHSTQGNKATK